MTGAELSGANTKVVMPDAALDDVLLEEMRGRTGLELRISHSTFNDQASPMAIRKFTDGIGDVNPLWRDADRAKLTAYHAPVAPPSFIIGCFSGLQFGWPGLGAFHAGTDIVFHRPVMVGDVVAPTCVYDGFDGPKPSSFAGQMV